MKSLYQLIFTAVVTLCCCGTMAQGQTVISGIVTDQQQQPIAGVSVLIKGTTTGTQTDESGAYHLQNVPPKATLLFRSMGYTFREATLSASGRQQVNITLSKNTQTIKEVEVVSTGYQTIARERATGAFEKISPAALNRSITTDIVSKLEGVSTILFDRRNKNANLSIRGTSTLYGNNQPLIIVDNFPYTGDISNINPNDVESATILKDAAAASIWGVRASNGVIVITTKKGKYKAKPSLDVTINYTYGKKPDLFYSPQIAPGDFVDVEKMLFSKGYYDAYLQNVNYFPQTPVVDILEAVRNGSMSAAEGESKINTLRNHDLRNDFGKYIYRNSFNQQYSAVYKGGAENISYLFSAGYDRDLSYLTKNSYNRYTFRSENTYKPIPQLDVNLGLYYMVTRTDASNNQTVYGVPTGKGAMYPYASIADQNGNALPTIKNYRLGYIDTAGAGRLMDWNYRMLDELSNISNITNQTDAKLNLGLTYRIGQHISLDGKYQYQRQDAQGKLLYNENSYEARSNINLFTILAPTEILYQIPKGSILDNSNNVQSSHMARGQVNADYSWTGGHDLVAIAGAEIRQDKIRYATDRTYGYNNNTLTFGNVNYVDYLPTYNSLAGSTTIGQNKSFAEQDLRFTSLFANAAYTYSGRYTLSGSVRKDASNLFGVSSNRKGVPLWSVGGGWNVSEESFYQWHFMPRLKLRATYGFNGNVDNTLAAVTTINYFTLAYLTQQPWALIMNPPNPSLRWEKVSVLNFGADFSLVDDIIIGTIEYYQKSGTDLIGFSPVDPTTGVYEGNGFTYKGNVANMRGSGIEVSLHSNNINRKFKWSTDVLFSQVKTKVTRYEYGGKLGSAYINDGTLVNPIVGKPAYSILSYQWAGLNPQTGDPQGYVDGKVSQDYTALTNVGIGDLQYSGSAVPTIFGSLRNSFSYKGWELSVMLMYKMGYYFRKSSIDYSGLFSTWVGHADIAGRWQQPGDEKHTDVPSMIYPAISNRDAFYLNSAANVEKGDHVRLQDISLSYRPEWKKQKLPFKQVTFNAYARNLGIIWKANKVDLDPDYYSGGFPLPLTIAAGVRIGF